ncbi:MAG: hypothetical protein AAF414_24260, partial [Pseudomonadota bacterium]
DAVAGTGRPGRGPLILAGGPALTDAAALGSALTGREWDPYEVAERGGIPSGGGTMMARPSSDGATRPIPFLAHWAAPRASASWMDC